MEVGDNRLNFLNVTLIINNNKIEFDRNYKLTFSERYLNFLSHHPISHKRSIARECSEEWRRGWARPAGKSLASAARAAKPCCRGARRAPTRSAKILPRVSKEKEEIADPPETGLQTVTDRPASRTKARLKGQASALRHDGEENRVIPPGIVTASSPIAMNGGMPGDLGAPAASTT
ncbi:hypothetical protein ALC56_07089 [Trachymyrmex septentrionalis]|uniref:Uncharacterized protein n=1 Tax=Trachymyrmex septentrionalis TaxID=34720 RepID=A0A151JWB7_9HYME|nr:hypothetical protein ALC56_07089 [Trachymyrmex septentrionalis]